ncbi:MAG: hypothetical protein U9N12_09210 [Euryarchaeota archaeon]|nr:hypothetical protein [Euryarchaeota archaeon]
MLRWLAVLNPSDVQDSLRSELLAEIGVEKAEEEKLTKEIEKEIGW